MGYDCHVFLPLVGSYPARVCRLSLKRGRNCLLTGNIVHKKRWQALLLLIISPDLSMSVSLVLKRVGQQCRRYICVYVCMYVCLYMYVSVI